MIDEAAYQYALQQNKGKTFSMESPDECFRYFVSCYEAKRGQSVDDPKALRIKRKLERSKAKDRQS